MSNMDLEHYLDFLKKHPNILGNHNVPIRIIEEKEEILSWQDKQKELLVTQNLPDEWAKIGIVLEDRYIIVLRDLVEFPDGRRNGYVRMIPRSDLAGGFGVVMLPIYQDKIVLLNHFRHSTRKWHLEIPRGYGEPELSTNENAIKELSEEIGATVSELLPLGAYYPETGFESQKADLFLARLSNIGVPALEEGIASFKLLSITELEEMIAYEQVTDGFTIAAYTKAKLKGLI